MSTLKFTVNGNMFTNDGGLKNMIPFALEADKLGYDYLRLLDHVVGHVAEKHPEVAPTPYTHRSEFLEVFTLMAHLSALTENLGFITGVLGLPARQTALVAKQAAQVDIMCGGRLILGVGIGYNSVEFEAMGADFKTRAPRVEEQIDIMRALWTQEDVRFEGRFHMMHDVSVNPRPIQRPIPIFMGAGRTAEPVPPPKVLERIGKYADGFMPLFQIEPDTGRIDDNALAALDTVKSVMVDHGRDPADFAIEMGVYPAGKSDAHVMDEIDYMRTLGVTHIHARFPNDPLEAQLDHIRGFAQVRDTYVRNRG